MNYAIILAGGIGLRMNAKIPKQMILIEKKPILMHTINTFYKHKAIDKIIVVCNHLISKDFNSHLKYENMNYKEIIVINGGKTRNDSLKKAYLHLKENEQVKDKDIILTHDGVRPFVSSTLISRMIEEFDQKKLLIPITKINNSIFREKNNKIEMIDRNSIFEIQTPQLINFKNFQKVFKDFENKFEEKSDWELTWIAKKMGMPIKTIIGEELNFKITNTYNLEVATALMKKGIKKSA